MLKKIDGIYRDGKVELTEVPKDVCDETRVLVTFLKPQSIDLRAGGIEISEAPKAAAPLKEEPRTGTVPKWPCTMTTKPPTPVDKRRDGILMLSLHADIRAARLRPALIVQADTLQTGRCDA